MIALKNISISYRRKTSLIVIAATLISCALISLSGFLISSNIAKKEIASEVSSFAKIVAPRLTASLAFEDAEYSKEILHSSLSHDSIDHACLYNRDGTLFAFSSNSELFACPTLQSQLEKTMGIGTFASAEISHRDRLYGTLYFMMNDVRISSFKKDALLFSLLTLIILLLLLTVPILYLCNKWLSRPVGELVTMTHGLAQTSQAVHMDELSEAIAIVDEAKKYITRANIANQTMSQKIDNLLSNQELSLSLFEKELDHYHNLNLGTTKIADASDYNREFLEEIFTVTRSELEQSIERLKGINVLFQLQKDLLNDSPEFHDLDTIFLEAFDEYFKDFGRKNIHAILANQSDGEKLNIYYRAFKSLLSTFFFLCDSVVQYEGGNMIFTREETGAAQQAKITISFTSKALNLFVKDDDLEAHRPAQTPCTEKDISPLVKSTVEKLKFFANLHSNRKDNLSIKLDTDLIEISFLVEASPS